MSQASQPSRASAPVSPGAVGSHAAGSHTSEVPWKDNILGNARAGQVQNVSWGSIFAGVVTFLGIVFLFSLLTTAFGLDGSGTAAGVVSIVGVVIGFFAGGAVAGAMAVQGGAVHGFLTWATSILATVVLVVMLTLGTAGAIGGALGSVIGGLGEAAGPAVSNMQPSDVPSPTAEQQAQAQEAAQQAAEAAKSAATYAFWGLLLGSAVAAAGGLIGSRSVNSRRNATDPTVASAPGRD